MAPECNILEFTWKVERFLCFFIPGWWWPWKDADSLEPHTVHLMFKFKAIELTAWSFSPEEKHSYTLALPPQYCKYYCSTVTVVPRHGQGVILWWLRISLHCNADIEDFASMQRQSMSRLTKNIMSKWNSRCLSAKSSLTLLSSCRLFCCSTSSLSSNSCCSLFLVNSISLMARSYFSLHSPPVIEACLQSQYPNMYIV